MNSQRTRKINRFASLAAAVLMLAACVSAPLPPSGSNSGVTPSPTRRSSPATSTPVVLPTPDQVTPLEKYRGELKNAKVMLWHPFSGKSADLLVRLADEFTRENEWGIQAGVISQGSSSALAEALDQPGEGGLPQIVLAPSAQLNGWMQSGRLADLNEYLAQPVIGMEARLLDGYNPVFWQQDQLAGAQVGIPALRTAYGLFYNRTWAAELGFTRPPATPDEFKTQACAAAKENNRSEYLEKRGTGGWLVDLSSETALSWFLAFDAQVLPEDDSKPYQFDQPRAKDALAFLRGMQAEGCLWLGRSADPYEYFSDRYALFTSGTLQDLSPQAKMNQDLESQDDWQLLAYPRTTAKPFVLSDGYSYGLLKAAPETQLAGWLFIRWLNLPENQARTAELYPSMPVSAAWKDQTADYRVNFPWTQILPLENQAILPGPSLASWIVARRPVEDAFWQVFNLATPDQLDDILPELDGLIREQLGK